MSPYEKANDDKLPWVLDIRFNVYNRLFFQKQKLGQRANSCHELVSLCAMKPIFSAISLFVWINKGCLLMWKRCMWYFHIIKKNDVPLLLYCLCGVIKPYLRRKWERERHICKKLWRIWASHLLLYYLHFISHNLMFTRTQERRWEMRGTNTKNYQK